MPVIDVGSYSVTIEVGALSTLGAVVERVAPAHRYVVITDENVRPRYAARVVATLRGDRRADVLTVPADEAYKTRESWARLTDEMLAAGVGRDTTVIALGGGVVGDLAGFVAATYMRGVPVLQVPTTLLAMIDSSIGGKTGVDTPAGKNLVGAFHQPAAVIADPLTLCTLPPAQLRAGLAEAIKHGAIADAAYFDRIRGGMNGLLDPSRAGEAMMRDVIARSVEIKAQVVQRDEREGGLRKILNFGHTIGHAVELLSDYEMLHGEAIAIGMALEAELAERLGIAEFGTAERLLDLLSAAGLPTRRPSEMAPERIVQATKSDKKARRGVTEYSLPRRIGAMAGESSGWSVRVEDARVLEVLS